MFELEYSFSEIISPFQGLLVAEILHPIFFHKIIMPGDPVRIILDAQLLLLSYRERPK